MEDEVKRIFSMNLVKFITESGRTQKQIADDLGFLPSTLNTWCKGTAFPSTGKLQALADYFGVKKSDLIEEKGNKSSELECVYVSIDERNVLQIYRRLNSSGKEQLLEYARFLSSQDKFAVSNDDSDAKEA